MITIQLKTHDISLIMHALLKLRQQQVNVVEAGAFHTMKQRKELLTQITHCRTLVDLLTKVKDEAVINQTKEEVI